MYDGTGIVDVDTRETQIGDEGGDTIEMSGWFVANGQASTPNLIDKFLRGEVASANTGGSDDAIVVEHTHQLRGVGTGSPQFQCFTASQTTTFFWKDGVVGDIGVSGVDANIPSYYSVIYIIRMS